MHSPNLTDENIEKIRHLFPGCVTEAEDENGKLCLAVDFDQLRQELSDHIVEGSQERYHLNWPGKREALLTANAPIAKTLRPYREESVDFDTTKNLFIEGDNLEALKLLQETYLGQVKMIYIDPPYNTGNDFVYEDDFAEGAEEFLERSNQKDENGNRLVANKDTNGRFHSDWLSMIFPRIRLAKNLLSNEGVFFASIDDHEVDNLRKVCDEVFGRDNLIAMLPTVMNLKGNPDNFGFSDTHEYTLVYARNIEECILGQFDLEDEELDEWDQDNYGYFKRADTLRRTGQDASRERRPNGWFPVFISDDHAVYITEDDKPRNTGDLVLWPKTDDGEELSWTWSKRKIQEEAHNLIVVEGRNGKNIYKKQRPQLGDLPTKKPKSFFYKPSYSTSTATTELKKLLGSKVFDGPKPVPFIADLIKIGAPYGGLVLDFFAGSGTTGQAVLEQNARDGFNRKFILVQIPEDCDQDSPAFKAGYYSISKIAKARLIKSGETQVEGVANNSWDKDVGFRVLKVDTSNMADIYYKPHELSQSDLLGDINNIKEGRDNGEDLLFQVLLDWGVDLTLPIERRELQGKSIYFVNEEPYDLIACFEKGINEDLVKEMASHQPMRVVFRDIGFASDAVKINVEQIFKQLSPATDVKSI